MTVIRKTTPVNGLTQAINKAVGLDGLSEPSEPAEPTVDLIRSLVQSAIQDAINTEFNQFLGSAPYERTEHRQGYRNGSYQRSFKTRVGTIELEIPRDREGNVRVTFRLLCSRNMSVASRHLCWR